MSAGFTPGPWSASSAGAVYTSDGFDPLDPRDVGKDEAKANANLIGAAPALYSVCERLCELMGEAGVFGMESETDPVLDLLFKARAALAKARGDLVDPLEQVKL